MEIVIFIVIVGVLIYLYLEEEKRKERQKWAEWNEEQERQRLQIEREKQEVERLRQRKIDKEGERARQQQAEQERRVQESKTIEREREIAQKAKQEAEARMKREADKKQQEIEAREKLSQLQTIQRQQLIQTRATEQAIISTGSEISITTDRMISVNKDNDVYQIKELEHMVHYSNLENILKNGLLSHNEAQKKGLIKNDISMSEVQDRRHRKTFDQKGLKFGVHDLVSFYFNSKNPMLYKRKDMQSELVILIISADILKSSMEDKQFAIFTDGNAGSGNTKFYNGVALLDKVDLKLLRSGSWNHADEAIKSENRRKMCAEVLVYPSVNVSLITKIVCPNQNMVSVVNQTIRRIGSSCTHIEVTQHTGYFFL